MVGLIYTRFDSCMDNQTSNFSHIWHISESDLDQNETKPRGQIYTRFDSCMGGKMS